MWQQHQRVVPLLPIFSHCGPPRYLLPLLFYSVSSPYLSTCLLAFGSLPNPNLTPARQVLLNLTKVATMMPTPRFSTPSPVRSPTPFSPPPAPRRCGHRVSKQNRSFSVPRTGRFATLNHNTSQPVFNWQDAMVLDDEKDDHVMEGQAGYEADHEDCEMDKGGSDQAMGWDSRIGAQGPLVFKDLRTGQLKKKLLAIPAPAAPGRACLVSSRSSIIAATLLIPTAPCCYGLRTHRQQL